MEKTTEQRMSEARQIIDHVRSMSRDFVDGDMPVTVELDKVEALADTMKTEGKMTFDSSLTEELNQASSILVELFASAINYCFWYGRYDFRPMIKDSYSMYDVVIDAVRNNFNGTVDHPFIDSIIDKLTFDRYPLLEQRITHIVEVSMGTQEFVMFVLMNKNNAVEIVLHELVRRYPGFSSDMFLKRAFLFVIQLNRKLGFFEDSINRIPVPADYQVPKMLEHFGCLTYYSPLAQKINNHVMVSRYSMEEISIRSGTIIVCDRLSKLLGWTIAEVDAWLWLRRKECKKPFHLTVTTDY
jgi:hypothetical protein